MHRAWQSCRVLRPTDPLAEGERCSLVIIYQQTDRNRMPNSQTMKYRNRKEQRELNIMTTENKRTQGKGRPRRGKIQVARVSVKPVSRGSREGMSPSLVHDRLALWSPFLVHHRFGALVAIPRPTPLSALISMLAVRKT